jgi:hypothetical protein
MLVLLSKSHQLIVVNSWLAESFFLKLSFLKGGVFNIKDFPLSTIIEYILINIKCTKRMFVNTLHAWGNIFMHRQVPDAELHNR